MSRIAIGPERMVVAVDNGTPDGGPTGQVAFWSACPEPGFIPSLERAGFAAQAHPAKAHERAKRHAPVIYVAQPVQEEAAEPEQV